MSLFGPVTSSPFKHISSRFISIVDLLELAENSRQYKSPEKLVMHLSNMSNIHLSSCRPQKKEPILGHRQEEYVACRF